MTVKLLSRWDANKGQTEKKCAGFRSEYLRGHDPPSAQYRIEERRRPSSCPGVSPRTKGEQGTLAAALEEARHAHRKSIGHVFPGLSGPRTFCYLDESWCRSFSSCTHRFFSVSVPALPILS